jgi:hypothetical protein
MHWVDLNMARIDAERHMPKEPWRCERTGNPVGTDTVMVGAPPCTCQGCREAAMQHDAHVRQWRAYVFCSRWYPGGIGRDINLQMHS